MPNDLLLTRDEVLGGLPSKRASALVFLIESRTAHLVERSRHTMKPFQTEDAARDRDLAFVEAFALGREPPLRPSIQDLERHAPQWADLIPANPRLRAAVVHLLGQKYEFTQDSVPSLRVALGMDGDPVQQAYQRLYREPLHTIFASRASPASRFRWGMARLGGKLESLPPFWTAFALTLTETVGAGVLALPIALAGIGPLPGIFLLVVFGLVNVITIAWMAESAARTASIRYGGAYFGRMVTEYLGNAGSLLLTIALVIVNTTILLAYAIGFSTTLTSATGVAAAVWIALLFAVVGYMVSRDSLSSTVASALAIGAVNLVLILILTGFGFAHLSGANLGHMEVPGIGGHPFELSLLGLIFGVILSAYFGHTSVGNCAAVVLKRDPSARSLIWGAASAQICAIAVYSVWVLGINGAISSGVMTSQTGTALVPLASVAGPAVYVFGSVFVVLAMGMGSVHRAIGLVNVVRERLPRQSHPVVLLPRTAGRLVFQPRGRTASDGNLRVVLTYLGLTGDQPRFQVLAQVAGETRRVEKTGVDLWAARESLDQLLPGALQDIDLTVRALSATEDQVRVQISSRMSMTYEGGWTSPGLDLANLLDASADEPDEESELLRWMLRQGNVDADAIAAWTGQDKREVEHRLQALIARGAVREMSHDGVTTYRSQVARRRSRHVPASLQQSTAQRSLPSSLDSIASNVQSRALRFAGAVASERGRHIVEFSPLVTLFLAAEWLVLTDRASFTNVLSFSGVIAVPIFAGIFPCLMLVSSRRKGDMVPGGVSRYLGRPWLTISVYTLFLLGILLHGLVIWEQPAQRAAAIVVGMLMLGVSLLTIRRGAFMPRTVVMVREDQRPGGTARLEVVSRGQRVRTDAQLDYDDGSAKHHDSTSSIPNFAHLRRITITLPGNDELDLKVWANRIAPGGEIESLPARLLLTHGADERQMDLRQLGGQVLLPRLGASGSITIALDPPATGSSPPAQYATGRTGRADLHALLSRDSDASTLREGEQS